VRDLFRFESSAIRRRVDRVGAIVEGEKSRDTHDRMKLEESAIESLVVGSGEAAWKQAHHELTRLAREGAAHDFDVGCALLIALRNATHVMLGYGSFVEYVERLFGYAPRCTHDRVRVAEALELLPALSCALRKGELCWSVVRELTRVATPQNEAEWIAIGKGRTVRDVEELVAGHHYGDRPSDPRDERARRHALRFDVSAETYALFREAIAKERRDAGGGIDDDAALMMLARRCLGGARDEGRSSHQIVHLRCPDCAKTRQVGGGQMVVVGSEQAEMAECDAQHVHADEASTHVGRTTSERATQSIPPATRRLIVRRDGGRCRVPGCRAAVFLDVHHVFPRSEGGDHAPEHLLLLCGAHHTAVHRGQLFIEGSYASGFVFRHADGSTYGGEVSPERAAVMSEAFLALRSLGYGETESRVALAELATHVGHGAKLEDVVRRALAALRAGRSKSIEA
jgi:hypothetical protein